MFKLRISYKAFGIRIRYKLGDPFWNAVFEQDTTAILLLF